MGEEKTKVTLEIKGIVQTTKTRSEWEDDFRKWLESRGEYFGGTVFFDNRMQKQVISHLRPGDRVRHCKHRDWGEGTVNDLSLSGRSAYVKWDDGRWHGVIKIDKLVRLDHDGSVKRRL
ncbi:DUF3553 domain-containing protein [Alicyclobacillus macrosporangiidus]|uniref:DUF3553 domain-containing protein n=1 Tax=Alicyclobacillus macrosporangiidus TaxID=392015 RepID=UPI0004962AB5|nr:DUF3553 domain-containing protein [Alicyclobacillus macrosporangiidus]